MEKIVYTGSRATCNSLAEALESNYAVHALVESDVENATVSVVLRRGATGRGGSDEFFKRLSYFIAGFTARRVGRGG